MGYANPAQLSAGIHTRQFSRAFVIDDGTSRVVFVSVDAAMIDQIVKTEVRSLISNKNFPPPQTVSSKVAEKKEKEKGK